MFDLILRGGSVADGTGAPRFPADVAVQGGRIVEISPKLAASASGEIDLDGLVLAPGFIDLHSHSDLLFTLPESQQRQLLGGRLRQGITTELVGNCGYGPAPVTEESLPLLQKINGFITPDGVSWDWRSFAEFLEVAESRGPLLNMAALVSHGAVRIAAMGMKPDLPSTEELRSMDRSIRDALAAGAYGISYGLIYPPGQFARTDELVSTAASAAAGGGFAAFHQRGSGVDTCLAAVEEILEVGRRGRCPVHHSHEESVGPDAWGLVESVIRREERARREGIELTMDVIPYTWVCTTMLAVYPPWALEGGVEAFLERLRDPFLRSRMKREVGSAAPSWPPWEGNGWIMNLVREVGWERIHVGHVNSEANRSAVMLNLVELAAARRREPFDALSDLMLEEKGVVTQLIFGISGDARTDLPLLPLIAHPDRALVSDAWDIGKGSPHPGAYGAFPRVLGHYVQERGLLTLEEAIRKMTSLPAARLGVSDRGVVRPGAHADLVAFDPVLVRDRATCADPRLYPDGIELVVVNGTVAVRGGEIVAAHAGRVLRRGAA
ncbi:MAG TPA: D-aminoacylase [Candidatus Polarisedimenticolia bacterium]|nr:D-aminoacylase [Candidatus Polarisedimenticolia bacterium]